MNWRQFLGLERRSSAGYTDALVRQLQSRASGISPDPGGVGALEVAAGQWARGLASATVSPESSVTAALTPAVLASMGRGLVRNGEALYVLEVSGNRLKMIEAASWDVSGSYDPDSWTYRVELPGPSDNVSRSLPASSVVHVRFAVHPSSPWKGVSPLEFAATTGQLGANLETRLSEESGGPVGYVLPVPSDGGDGSADDPLVTLKSDLATLKGGISLVETTTGGWNEGRGSAPARDWVPQRLGASVPSANVNLWTGVGRMVLAACGVPPSLADQSADGTAQRESWRRFLHGTLQPVARIIEQECQSKLESGVSLGFRALMASDLAGRARAFGALTGGGKRAKRFSGCGDLRV